MKRTTSPKVRRVTISEQKEEEQQQKKEERMEGKRKRMQSSVAEIPKRKRFIAHSTSSEEDEDSSEMDTDSGSEDVFESNGPRFRANGQRKEKAIVEFKGKKSHAACRFEDDDFDILHADIRRAEILRIATEKPECLDRLD